MTFQCLSLLALAASVSASVCVSVPPLVPPLSETDSRGLSQSSVARHVRHRDTGEVGERSGPSESGLSVPEPERGSELTRVGFEPTCPPLGALRLELRLPKPLLLTRTEPRSRGDCHFEAAIGHWAYGHQGQVPEGSWLRTRHADGAARATDSPCIALGSKG